ncbi:MAG: Hsp20/alpha crystallin family protein [Cyanophyceae cyanobacterium]
MALVRWQPFQELSHLRQQMDRLFGELMSDRNWESLSGNGNIWAPAIEIQETDQNIVVKAEIPGVEAQDLDVQVAPEEVSIAGEHREEKQTEEGGVFRSEFNYGQFQRRIPLPVPVQQEQVKSEFKNGILTLTLPKIEDAQRKVVKIKVE